MSQKNFFILPNDIFNLKLDAYEFLIYSYLVSCTGKSGVCWPSLQTMSRMLKISTNTIVRKIDSLVSKKLVEKENTTNTDRNGKTRTANNRYYIRSFMDAWDAHFRFGERSRQKHG